jgi:hypothetical protein
MESYKIDVLPLDALVKVEFSGDFYQRLQNCLIVTLQEKEDKPEELAIVLKELETRQPANPWEERVYILLTIVHEIDIMAAEQKVLVKKTVNVPANGEPPEVSPES